MFTDAGSVPDEPSKGQKSWESWVGENCKFARPINVRFRSTLVDFHFQVKISLEISTRSLLNLKQEFSHRRQPSASASARGSV